MRKLLPCCWGAALLLAVSEPIGRADPEPSALPRGVTPEERLKPTWKVGQKWVVESLSERAQVASSAKSLATPVRWEFAVLKRERVGDHDCLRLEVVCKTIAGVPPITLWVDEKSLAPRQVETTLLLQGETRRVKERIDFHDGQPSAVLGLTTPIPLDLPTFSTVRVRGAKSGYSTTVVGEGKPAEELAFSCEVEQSISPAGTAMVRGLLGDGDADKKTTYKVLLKGAGCEVQQLWKPGMPWPSHSRNGGTTTRLIEVIAAPVGR